jgi:predicted unusual protein kinase regulating ubiquinone biosynthesis (AarF/ABC1/UbiB family)
MRKSLVTAEGSARQINPHLDVVAKAEPYIKNLAAQRYKPAVLLKNFRTKFCTSYPFRGKSPGFCRASSTRCSAVIWVSYTKSHSGN